MCSFVCCGSQCSWMAKSPKKMIFQIKKYENFSKIFGKIRFSYRLQKIFRGLGPLFDRTFHALSFKHSGYVGASLVLELSRFFMILSSWFSIFWFFWPNDSFFDMALMEFFVAYEPINNIGALLKCFWDLDFWPDSPYYGSGHFRPRALGKQDFVHYSDKIESS